MRVRQSQASGGELDWNGLRDWPVIPVVADNFPAKEFVFHFGPRSNVVDDHVTATRSLLVHDDADMGHAATQVPSDDVTRYVIRRAKTFRQSGALSCEENHQVGNSPVINIGVRMSLPPMRIDVEIV